MSKSETTEMQYIKVPAEEDTKSDTGQTDVPQKYGYGVRHVQLVILFFCLSMSLIARGHMGMTLVAMTVPKNTVENISSISYENCTTNCTEEFNIEVNVTETNVNDTNEFDNASLHNATDDNDEKWTVYRNYDWTKPNQEMILNAFFLGYCIMTTPIGLVCQRWGGKLPLQISLFVNGIVSLSSPWLALWGGWKAMTFCRFLQGLTQAATYPSIQTLVSHWASSEERATLINYVYTGTTLGTVIGFQISGILCDSAWGWPSTYWTVGVLCLLTFSVLTAFGANTPRVHKSISDGERNYILGHSDTGKEKRRKIPWKAVFTSKAVWGIFATHVGSAVSFIFFLTEVPSYIHFILGINIKSSGILSSLPYLASFCTSLTYGAISDYFTNRNIVSVKNARRISNTISQVGVAIALIATSYAASSTTAVCCLVISMCLHMGIHTGWVVNYIDISPNYSGTLLAFGSTLTNLVALLLPILISNILTDIKDVYQWRIMLYIVAGIAFIPNLVFIFLMSDEVQPWNDGEDPDADKLEKEKKKTNK